MVADIRPRRHGHVRNTLIDIVDLIGCLVLLRGILIIKGEWVRRDNSTTE